MKQEEIESRNPQPGEWFRVNPDLASQGEGWLIVGEDGKDYLVMPNMVPEVRKLASDKLRHVMFFMAQNKDGETFLWPIPLPFGDDHPVYRAMDEWIQLP